MGHSLLSIISFINNHKDKVEQELSKNLIENPNYKYKDINSIKTEIESETNKLLKKLQPYTKKEYFHYLCVLNFVKKGID